MDPLSRPIQAKLINDGGLIDAIPGALPVYFGSEVSIKAESISKVIIGGKSQSVFYLDTRNTTEQQEPPTLEDMQEVFMIETSAELDDETAEALVSNIVTNQDSLMYFSNFDHWIDWVTVSFWVLGLSGLVFGGILILRNNMEDIDLTTQEKVFEEIEENIEDSEE